MLLPLAADKQYSVVPLGTQSRAVGDRFGPESTLHSLHGTNSNIAIVNWVYKIKYILGETKLLEKVWNVERESNRLKKALKIHLAYGRIASLLPKQLGCGFLDVQSK